MATNSMIALGIQPLQLNNPLDAYAKASQIQNAQNQNSLVKYQLQNARREDDITNAMSQSYGKNYSNGVLNEDAFIADVAAAGGGSKIQGLRKGFDETRSAKTKAQKDQIDLIDTRLKQSRRFLDGLDPNSPDAPAQYIAWHEANHSDPILGPELAARGVTADQSRARIMAMIDKPGGIANMINESKLGADKFIEMNKPAVTSQDTGDGGRLIARPGLGGPATVVEGSEFTKRTSEKEKRQLDIQERRLTQGSGSDVPTDPEAELDFLRRKELAKAQGKAEAKTGATTAGGVRSARETLDVLDEIDRVDPKTGKSLLNTSTASGIGSLTDKIGNFIGASSDSADSASALRVIEGKLLAVAPKLGGSTSNADLKFYKQAAAEIGDSRIPASQKAKALETIRRVKLAEIRSGETRPTNANRKPLTDILGE